MIISFILMGLLFDLVVIPYREVIDTRVEGLNSLDLERNSFIRHVSVFL